jgi:hypothetical protein
MTANSDVTVNITLPEVANKETTCEYPLSNVKIHSGGNTYTSLFCRSECTVKCNIRSNLWERIGDGHVVRKKFKSLLKDFFPNSHVCILDLSSTNAAHGS